MKITKLLDADITKYFQGDEQAESTLQEALNVVKSLSLKLHQLRDADTRMVQVLTCQPFTDNIIYDS